MTSASSGGLKLRKVRVTRWIRYPWNVSAARNDNWCPWGHGWESFLREDRLRKRGRHRVNKP